MIRCTRLFTGPDGQSHVETITLPPGALQAAKAVHVEETAAGSRWTGMSRRAGNMW